MIDTLIERIKQLNNPTAVGLDTSFEYLPENMKKPCSSLADAGKAITEFNFNLIDGIKNLVPSVKVQVAYYEMYGCDGIAAFAATLKYAKKSGLITIADCKRNDIGSTASCYSSAYLGSVKINGREYTPFESDFLTVNGYLGSDGLKPFIADCESSGKGIFVLVKTSNPSSGELQDRVMDNGRTLYENTADLVVQLGKTTVGKYGYSSVGAVIGATHPAQAEDVRRKFPSLFFLIPGYGAQGGSVDGLTVCFDGNGLGGVVNNSRGIICAYKNPRYSGMNYVQAAVAAVNDMQADIYRALKKAGKAK